MRRAGLLLVFIAVLLLTLQTVRAQGSQGLVLVMNATGEVDAGMLAYVERGISTAEQRKAEALVIQLDTPGGDTGSMQSIMEAIRSSTVPVVVYVAPNGAAAGSAGALITMAAHVAAMTPEAVIGASSPIGSGGQELDPTLKAKLVEFMKAKVRPLVEPRGPAATQLAQDMIQNAKAVTANEALKVHLIDFIATDLNDVLRQLNGRTVALASGAHILNTASATVESLDIGPIEQLLRIITQPNIAFILLAVGVLALQVELTHPGAWIPGFIGITCVALAIYGIGLLPVNWFGLIFVIMAFVLFLLDIKAPTHGALTVAGVASFIVGALVLFNSSPGVPQFERVSVPLVIGVGVAFGLMFAAILTFALRAQREPIQTGASRLIGKLGTARSDIGSNGQVQVESELWTAEAAPGSAVIGKGDRIEVVEVRGLRLKVRKI
ncbi:MAG: NfeD family protein [Anaerolineae bacterium]